MNDKQKRFIAEYLIDLNATQAAIRAGYSENGASVQASRMLANPSIAAAIEKAMDKTAIKTGRQVAQVLEDIQAITREAWRNGDYKTALRGLEMEGKHLGMFRDKLEATVSGNIALKWE